MGAGASSSYRYGDYIDIYVRQPDSELAHFWANPTTGWNRCREVIAGNCAGRPAVVRHENSIDVYYRSNNSELVHFWAGDHTGWQYLSAILATGLAQIDPVAVRFNQAIDVFFVAGGGQLTHLNAGEHTGWAYNSNILEAGNYSCLCALRVGEHMIDLFYIKDGRVRHRSAGTHSDWVYGEEATLDSPAAPHMGALSATRFKDYIDVFFNAEDCVHQAHMSSDTNWKLTNYGPIHPDARAGFEIKALRWEDNIDVYYTVGGRIFHSYIGIYSNWLWRAPVPISEADYTYGLTAVRTATAIDVFYVAGDNRLRGLCIGDGTGGDWSAYRYVEPRVSNRRQIRWEDLVQRGSPVLLGQGWHGYAFRVNIEGVVYVAKKFKRPDFDTMEKEMRNLDYVSQLWPGILLAELTENFVLAGFIIKFFEGKRINDWIKDPEVRADKRLRAWLVVAAGQAISAIQRIGLCHSDLIVDNVLAKRNGRRWEVQIIDFGNAIIFDNNTHTTSTLTGWAFMRPPEWSSSGYHPIGVNGYQFAWLAMCILALKDGSTYPSLGSKSQLLNYIKQKGFDRRLVHYIEKLVRETNPSARLVSGSKLKQILESGAPITMPNQRRRKDDSPIIGPKWPIPAPLPTFISMQAGEGQNFRSSVAHKAFIKSHLKPLAQLAHLLGFAWSNPTIADQPGKFRHTLKGDFLYEAESVEQITGEMEYVVVGRSQTWSGSIPYYDWVQKREGERSWDRLKIVFGSFENIVTESRVVDQVDGAEVPMQRYEEEIDHKVKANLESGYQKAYKSHTKVEVTDESTKTFESEVTGKFELNAEVAGFGVGFSMEVRAMEGTQVMHGAKVETQDTSELELTKKLIVQKEGKYFLKIQVYGRKVLTTCRVTTLNRCKVALVSWLHFGHYHRTKKCHDMVEYVMGRDGKSFEEFLKQEIEQPEFSQWDWERLFRERPGSRELVDSIIKSNKKSTDIHVAVTRGIRVATSTHH